MIFDQLVNLGKYATRPSHAVKLMSDFAAQADAITATGKYPLDGNRIFALVQEYTPGEFGTAKVEVHRRMIDIHMPMSGEEMICYCPVEDLELLEDFTPDGDHALYKPDPRKTTTLIASPGSFVWFHPGEGHIPGLKAPDSPATCRKIVFKVDADIFGV